MEICNFCNVVSGKIELPINFHEENEGFGWSCRINVWVDYNDSRTATRKEALIKAKAFMERMMVTIDAEINSTSK